jgi:hypothetical protein
MTQHLITNTPFYVIGTIVPTISSFVAQRAVVLVVTKMTLTHNINI